jgi:hypothetical protein
VALKANIREFYQVIRENNCKSSSLFNIPLESTAEHPRIRRKIRPRNYGIAPLQTETTATGAAVDLVKVQKPLAVARKAKVPHESLRPFGGR